MVEEVLLPLYRHEPFRDDTRPAWHLKQRHWAESWVKPRDESRIIVHQMPKVIFEQEPKPPLRMQVLKPPAEMPEQVDELESSEKVTCPVCNTAFSLLQRRRETKEAGQELQIAQPIQSPAVKYVGSIKSSKYQHPNCLWAQQIKPENQIWFSSAKEALDMGYVPCKVCNPPPTTD